MNVFDAIRDRVALDRILLANGTGKARCVAPEHQDNASSMHVYDDHVRCFACGFHGDVTDVWAVMHGFSQPFEAALDLARKFGIKVEEVGPDARRKARERREKEDDYLTRARACHQVLERHPRVREWWAGRGFGEQLREKFLLGTNRDGTFAVIPFWHRGRIRGLIRRKLEGEPKYMLPNAEEFPGGYRPLFIPGSLTGEIFLVEDYVDALAVAATGRPAVAVGGTNDSEEQLTELKRILRIRDSDPTVKVYILPDRGDRGADAATQLARTLYPAARICPADYGEGRKDVADLFSAAAEKTIEHLNCLVEASTDILDAEMEAAAEIKDRRERLTYATKNIAPLLVPIHPEGLRDATADIVADTTKLKKSWINKAIEDHLDTLAFEDYRRGMQRLETEKEARQEEYRQRVAEIQVEIDELLAPGVLERLRKQAAKMHSVHGDTEPLELTLLVACGAQLDPLPNGRPLGASILLTATAGRGKNHIVDAAVKPLPPEFYFAFEIASGQSLYYKAEEDPDFLRHTFAYPNEIEGAEALWEFLRPMLSKGKATKIVTAKDVAGNMTTKTIVVEGPVTIAIPTIRNKTDEQLQTRLLVAELPDYVGRVREHSVAVSRQLLPDAAAEDHSRERWVWWEALRQLTDVRRVVFPLSHDMFALDDDGVSHGARVWTNLLSLMATHAWLEQKNRRVIELPSGEMAIEATPDDYAAAHAIFTAVCERSVINLSEKHRKILDATYDLREENPKRGGFSQREIAKGAGCSPQTVSNNKTFLVTSAKLLKETEEGLALVAGVEPEEWRAADITKGLPTPEQVRAWWEDRDPDPPGGQKTGGHGGQGDQAGQKADTYAEKDTHKRDGHPMDASTSGHGRDGEMVDAVGHVQQLSTGGADSGNGLGKPGTDGEEALSTVPTSPRIDEGSENGSRHPTEKETERCRELVRQGMSERLARRTVLAGDHALGCRCEVCR